MLPTHSLTHSSSGRALRQLTLRTRRRILCPAVPIMDRLIKSLDALSVVHITTEKSAEPFAASKLLSVVSQLCPPPHSHVLFFLSHVRKRDSPLSRKDKLSHCHTVADVITSPAIR